MAGFARRGHDPIFIPLGGQKDPSVARTFIGRIRIRNNSAVSVQENVALNGLSCLRKSLRDDATFVKLNCGATSFTMLEEAVLSEAFALGGGQTNLRVDEVIGIYLFLCSSG